MNTPLVFYDKTVDDTLDGRDTIHKELFSCYGEVYSPSNKDISVMNGNGVKRGLTIRIRDPLSTYHPQNTEAVLVRDSRFNDIVWDIIDIRPDVIDSRYLVVLLSGDKEEKLCLQK
ncbi:phage head-tail adapter protein [Lactococcus garvieae]